MVGTIIHQPASRNGDLLATFRHLGRQPFEIEQHLNCGIEIGDWHGQRPAPDPWRRRSRRLLLRHRARW
jgi:hypothetical protein